MAEEGFSLLGADGTILGFGGRMSPERVDAPAWAGPTWAVELFLPSEPAARPVPLFEPPPQYPGVDRDLAPILSKALPARTVEAVMRAEAGPMLVDIGVFDLYEGEGIPDGHRSVAFRLRYQSHDRTLTDDDVERSVRAVTDRLRDEFGVEPRG